MFVISVQSLRENVSMSMGMSVSGAFRLERDAPSTARRYVGRTGEVIDDDKLVSFL